MKRFSRVSPLLIGGLLTVIALALLFLLRVILLSQQATGEDYTFVPIATASASPSAVTPTPSGSPVATSTPNAALPKKALINVPFLSQAPKSNWDPLHEEACEEASLIMLKYALQSKTKISVDEGDQEILNMVAYEEKNGYGVSITLEQLAAIAKNYYDLPNATIRKNATIEGMKADLAAGKPIIIPAAGRELGNPNFRQPGPVYHMFVLKGYDENGFITNDPGTRKGENFRYSFDTLYNALHDYDKDDISQGAKSYLIFN